MMLYKYNPQRIDKEELKATFVAREQMLCGFLKELKNVSDSKSNQHYLIIGQRGIGKTNFLRMIYFGIKDDIKLDEKYIPLQFAEEEYSLANLRDLFEKILKILLEETSSLDVEEFILTLEEIDNDQIAAEKSIEFTKKYCSKNKKKIIVLIDNLDLILEEQFKNDIEVKRFRDILMNENYLTIIGATPTYFEEVANYNKPLYNFFKIKNLGELEPNEIEELIKKRAEFDKNNELINKIDKLRPKLLALKHLTGGNPRLILMLYQILTFAEFKEVKEYLDGLLDELTPYYQYKLRILSPQQKKIITTLAELSKAATPTQIAKKSRLEVNNVSTNLKRLSDDGYVKLAKQKQRKASYYIISERLFRMWYQMRTSPKLRKKIEMFVEFIQIWYSSEELKSEVDKLNKLFSEQLEKNNISRAKSILEQLDYFAEASLEVGTQMQLSLEVIQKMISIEDYNGAEERLNSKLKSFKDDNKGLFIVHFGLGIINKIKQNLGEALYHYKKALEIEPNQIDIMINYASLLYQNHNYDDALKYYDKALEINASNKTVWRRRGNALVRLNNIEEAILSYDKALELDSKYTKALQNKSNALFQENKLELSLVSIQEALVIEPKNPILLTSRGFLLAGLKRYAESIESIESAKKFVSEGKEKELVIYGYCGVYLSLLVQQIKESNYSAIKQSISKIIENLKQIKEKELIREVVENLIKMIRIVLSPQKKDMMRQLFDLMQENTSSELSEIMEPYRIANDYWLNDNDQEILDQLNPEMREIVEQIIEQGEKNE